MQALLNPALRPRPGSPTGSEPRSLTLRANFLWTFTGNVIYSGCQWGMLVVLARLGDVEMVGRFALGLAVTAPLFMFTNLQLRGVQATDARQEHPFGDYLVARLLTTAAALLVIGGILGLSGHGGEVAAIILAVTAAKACESISDIVYGLLQQHERMDRIAVSMVLRGLAALATLSMGVWLTHQLLWGVLGIVAAWFAVLTAYDCRSVTQITQKSEIRNPKSERNLTIEFAKQETPRRGFDFGHFALGFSSDFGFRISSLLWMALPLGVVTCLLSLNTNVPRYFIEHYLGLRALGIFSAVGYLMVAGNTVVAALAQSAWPRLAAYHAAGQRREFRRLLAKLTALSGFLGGLGLLAAQLAGPAILGWIYGRDYADQADLFVLLMMAAGVGYMASFFGYAVTAARYFRVQAPVFAIVGLVTAVASAWLVPSGGLCGAAWAVFLATFCQLVLLAAVLVFIYARMPKGGTSEVLSSKF
jgi:O-antigen/teichoic acid export membrane protein